MGEASEHVDEASLVRDAYFFAQRLLDSLEWLSTRASCSPPAEWSIVEPRLQQALDSWQKMFIALNTPIHTYDEECNHGVSDGYSDDCGYLDWQDRVQQLYPVSAPVIIFLHAADTQSDQYATALEAMDESGYVFGFGPGIQLRDAWNERRHLLARLTATNFVDIRFQLTRESAAYAARAQGMEPRIVAPTQKLKPHDVYAYVLRRDNPDRTQSWIAERLSERFHRVIYQGEVSLGLGRVDTFLAQGGRLPELKSAEPGPRPSTMNNLDGIAQTTEPVPGEPL